MQVMLNSACTASRFSVFPTWVLHWLGWGWASDWEETQLGQQSWMDQGNTPSHITSCPSVKPGRLSSWSSHCPEAAWASICLWEVVSDCFCITIIIFFIHLAIKLSLSWHMRFSSCFCTAYSLCHPAGCGSEWAFERVLGCWTASTHYINLYLNKFHQ